MFVKLVAEDYSEDETKYRNSTMHITIITLRFVLCLSLNGPLSCFDTNPLEAWFSVGLLRLEKIVPRASENSSGPSVE
jgi:hypothetical protein